MKLRTKLFGTFGVVAAAATIGVSPIVVSAQEVVDVDAAAFVGSTTLLNCGPGGPVPVTTCGLGGATNGVPLVGGSGAYSFNSSVCAGVSANVIGDEGGPADVEATTSCSINSNGNYINVVCGTGAVLGANATVAEGGGSDTYTTTGGLNIVFVSGVGIVAATGVTESEGDEGAGVAVGVVVLTPVGSQVPPPLGLCVTAFTVVGVIATNA